MTISINPIVGSKSLSLLDPSHVKEPSVQIIEIDSPEKQPSQPSQPWPKLQHQRTHQLKQQRQQQYPRGPSRQQHHSRAHQHKHQYRSQKNDPTSQPHPQHSQHRQQQEQRGGESSQTQLQISSESTTTPSSSSIYEPVSSPRIVFGSGTIACLPTELGNLQVSSPLIVSSPSRVSLAKTIQALIPNLNSRILDSAVASVSSRVIDAAVSRISDHDCVISVGGGSAVSLARAIGLRKGIPHICIPTTYSGSEVNPLFCDQKSALRESSKLLPTVVIYDEDLTRSISKRISAPDGLGPITYSSEIRHRKKDDDASWSFIHLPGV